MKNQLPDNIKKDIKEIENDNTSGSVELAKKSAEIIINLVNQTGDLEQIKKASLSLVEAQPNMASIFNLVNNLMFYIDKNKKQQLKKIVTNYCKNYLNNLENFEKKIKEQAINLIKNRARIITHSYSSTVLGTLLFLKESKKEISVICTESRPKNEGIKLAKELGKNKIKVKLLVDSAIFSLIPYADIILIGGDAITENGLINKIGTKGIATVAQHYKTPIYALCSTEKLLPKKYPINLDHLKNPNEIIQYNISNVTAVNYYFDLTPLDFFTGFITEKEILKPEEIKEIIINLKIHDNFSDLLSDEDLDIPLI
jgi:translation initiation factor 2B subunit (eIF-2B alpha/beta/delta family)